MIKLLGILSLFLPIFAREELYLLPNNHTSFLYDLSAKLKKSSEVTLLTTSFQHPKIASLLHKPSKKRAHITLIVNSPQNDPISLVQYSNITLRLSATPIPQTLILVDQDWVCSLQGGLEEERMGGSHSPIRCSDDPSTILAVQRSVRSILKSSSPYLE